MRILQYLLAVLIAIPALLVASSHVAAAPYEPNQTAIVNPTLYDELLLYAKYCAASYQPSCPNPMSNTLIETVRPPVLFLMQSLKIVIYRSMTQILGLLEL